MRQSEKHYRFAVLSDIHIDLENGGQNTYFTHAEKNFARALQVIRERGCDFIVSAGDQITNATGGKAEWERYRRIIECSGYSGQIFEAMGNHETRFARYGGCTVEECQQDFIRYTRLEQKPVRHEKGKTYYAYINNIFGDAFLFLSLENGVNTNGIDNFTDEQMDWAQALAERYHREGRRVFVIQHAPFYGFGAGDDTDDPAYEGGMRQEAENGLPYPNNRRFYELIHRYPQMIWLSGHTHVDLRDEVNYSSCGGKACHMLHIPALCGTTRLSYQEGKRALDRTFYEHTAQGYLADVYKDRVIFSGIEFTENRLYDEYTYQIDR